MTGRSQGALRAAALGRARAAPVAVAALVAAIAGCGGRIATADASRPAVASTVDIKLIAFNDLHGNLEPPRMAINAPAPGGGMVAVPAGGAAYMASAIKALKAANPNHAVVSAGDMISGSPLVSALFLDEPTIETVNEFGIDFNAVGNHEFDKGQDELLRMKNGGCARFTALQPCGVNPQFSGARFDYLAANVRKPDGSTLFAATGLKSFGDASRRVTVGFIGMTLKATPTIVTPSGVRGLKFEDEAATANALVPVLKAQGAQVIVVLIHEGAVPIPGQQDASCAGLSGDLLPILDQLDPAIDVVVSGHTHRAYVCDYARPGQARPLLLTSAGLYGTMLTDIELRFDIDAGRLISKRARNVIVQGEPFEDAGGATVGLTSLYPSFASDPAVATLVERYATAAAPLALRSVGSLTQSIGRTRTASGESPLGNLIADSHLAATKATEQGGAQIAFMNPGGVRADLLVPAGGGPVNYGQLFRTQPFGNNLVVKSMSGALLRALLEQQFASGTNSVAMPRVLFPSQGFSYSYDLAAPAGSRIGEMKLNGVALVDGEQYRVTMNSFLASGGDNFSAFTEGTAVLGGPLDLDALEDYLVRHSPLAPAPTDRISRVR